ncbi:MAG: hypothetical protein JW863_09940 [Chitinispirillaceae bacterium]|nr:hypothetical protein [Chitinispirillaceae bacterium]
MEDKKHYQKEKKAQLDTWKRELKALRNKASKASADMQSEINKHITNLERRIEEAGAKLLLLEKAGNDAWGSIKEGIDDVWGSLKSAIGDAASKFN